MTREETKSCIQTIELLRRLAFNVHGVMDVIDAQNCDKIIALLSGEACEDCVSRQAVFDALEKVAGLFPWRIPGKLDTYDSYNGAWNDAIGRAEMEIEGLPPVNPQRMGQWIGVDERLPENRNQEVLISLEWGIDIGRYSDGEWHSEWINHYDDGNVLAWMPLPKPYEPQENEGKE